MLNKFSIDLVSCKETLSIQTEQDFLSKICFKTDKKVGLNQLRRPKKEKWTNKNSWKKLKENSLNNTKMSTELALLVKGETTRITGLKRAANRLTLRKKNQRKK